MYEALFSPYFLGFRAGPFVDIVGVTGSIPVTPTIQLLEKKGLPVIREPFYVDAVRFSEPANANSQAI